MFTKVSHFRHLLLCSYCALWKVCNLLLGKTKIDRVIQLSHPPGLMKAPVRLNVTLCPPYSPSTKTRQSSAIPYTHLYKNTNLKNMLSVFCFHILTEFGIFEISKSLCCRLMCLKAGCQMPC